MKKFIMTLCLIIAATGAANAHPAPAHSPHPAPVSQHRPAPAPKPVPVVYQVPVYTGYYNSSPGITFSTKYCDVTVGL